MWVCINDAFLSIVSKDCARDELLVRARRPDDIRRIFPRAVVKRSVPADYRYRAVVKKADIKTAIAGEIDRITYSNFKDSVGETDLHNAYSRVWSVMAGLQAPAAGYSAAAIRQHSMFDAPAPITLPTKPAAKKRRPRRKK